MAVLIENCQKEIDVDIRRVRRTAHKIMRFLQCEDKEVGIRLVDDEEIRNLNKLYLKRDNPTNVLAFSMIEGEFGTINPDVLGDIVISVQTALRDAEASGMSLYDEIDFLVIHGILHLLGYNHEYTSEEEKKRMESKEREVFYHVKGYEIE